MRRASQALLPAIALLIGTTAHAVPGGEIGTLPIGRYQCELPGDAAGDSRLAVPDENFAIISASSYVAHDRHGTYLLTGDDVVMTSGPFNTKRFHRTSFGVLRQVGADGQEGPMRCVRIGSGHI